VVGSAVYRSADFSDAFSRGTRNGRVLDAALQVQWLAPFGISTGAGVSYGLSRDGLPNSYRYDLTLGRSFGRIGATITGSRTVFPMAKEMKAVSLLDCLCALVGAIM